MKLSDIAKEAKQIENELNINLDAVLNKLTQELGEFNDAVQKYRGIYSRKVGGIEEVKKEAGDLMLNFISVLEGLGINPDEINNYAENTLKNFKQRIVKYKNFKIE
jgi:NTP pyrophosphatase (non-canonical NTP hydrolase)